MALGDLLTDDYQVEYNGLLMGVGTQFVIYNIKSLLGFSARSATTSRFGRHGGVSGRHYAETKSVDLEGELISVTDSDFAAKKLAFGLAFAPVVSPSGAPYLAFQLPNGSGGLKLRIQCRVTNIDFPLDPEHARKNPSFTIRLEISKPILESLTLKTQAFTLASDTQTLTNSGNAPADWIATLTGPCTDPSITNDDTSQSISFSSLTVTGAQTLVFDSFESRVELNGVGTNLSLASGFSWFNLPPGDTDISVAATNAGSGSFSLAWRDSYWIA